jgi:hypothetical protein
LGAENPAPFLSDGANSIPGRLIHLWIIVWRKCKGEMLRAKITFPRSVFRETRRADEQINSRQHRASAEAGD